LKASSAISNKTPTPGSSASKESAASPSSTEPPSAGSAEDISDGTRAFGLAGPSLNLDPRVHAWRRDIADVALAWQVISSHYARPVLRACGSRATFLWPSPEAEGDAVSELLPGEGFAVVEYTGPWAWGYCTADHRVGYVEAIELIAPASPTHIVCEAKAPVCADGSIGATTLAMMPMGARLTGREEGACLMSEIGCMPMSHVRPLAEPEIDPAAVAMRLIHAPYRAGGRSHLGVDASGLIQLALGLCGVNAPRDLDQQREIGEAVTGKLRRGDIVIAGEGDAMEGGIMIDDLMLIHASRDMGKVKVVPASTLEARHESSVRRRADI